MDANLKQQQIDCTAAKVAEVDTDLLVIPVFEDDELADVGELDFATGHEISRARNSEEFKGNPYEIFLTSIVDSRWKAGRVALIGAGKPDSFSTDRLRKIATSAALTARDRCVTKVAFLTRDKMRSSDEMQSLAEGLSLGQFDGRLYKKRNETEKQLVSLILVNESSQVINSAVLKGKLLGGATNLARRLVQEPGNILTPGVFAERASEIVIGTGIDVKVFNEKDLSDLGMGLLLGVSRASAESPRLIVLQHDPVGAPVFPVLGLVGKGVTFDTGGISIKPADGMERMKNDMAGGAAVICAMRAIGVLNPPIRVIGIVPATENMLGGRAIKPGDVLIGAGGTSVEIINTDAEGRLILGDALWYAQQLGASHLVDIATLTGSCVVALGKSASGIFGTPNDWVDLVRSTAEQAGDRTWPLPLSDEYREQLNSDVADIANSGGRGAGACTAAMFLKEFAGEGPWVHLDIAGTAWCDETRPYQRKGPTGFGVRTLAELALTSQQW